MKFHAIGKTIALILLTVVGSLHANELDAVDGPNVRVTRHKDGSKTIFTRSPDNLTLTSKKTNANGVLITMTVYRMDANGNPRGCKIYDGNKNELYKSSYGYRKSDGRLVEERMFDSRVKRIDPNTGNEMPVRRFIYTYDAHGKRNKPIAITLTPGKTANEVYNIGPSALDANPFDDEKQPVNPNARPVGR